MGKLLSLAFWGIAGAGFIMNVLENRANSCAEAEILHIVVKFDESGRLARQSKYCALSTNDAIEYKRSADGDIVRVKN